MNRLCKICDNKLPIENFPKYTIGGKNYHRYECKDCFDPAKHYKENKEKILGRLKNDRLNNPEKYLLFRAKSRAKSSGIPFSISEADIIIPSHCPVLGHPLITDAGRRYAPSLDRIDPDKGYTPDNIQVISNLANTMKNNATPEELLAFARWIIANYQPVGC